jgi:hypothetical protein
MFRRLSGLSAGKYPVPDLDLNYGAIGALTGFETFARASSASVFDNSGVLTRCNANLPRFDHDPTTQILKVLKGLLIEEQRTNLLPNSNNFAAWSINNFIATGSAATAPTGANEAWLLNATTADGRTAVSLNIGADATVYTLSLYLKAGTAAVTDLRILFVSGNDVYARITWATASIAPRTTGHAFTPTLQSVGGGWYRAVMGAANTSRTQVLPYVFPAGQGTSVSGSVLAFGAQFEAGACPTSYIPTAGAAATRAGDVCTVPTSAFGYNTSEGTLFVEAVCAPANGNYSYAAIDDGTTNNQVQMSRSSAATSLLVRANGASQAAFDPAPIVPGATFKAALAYRADDFGAAVNGIAAPSDISGAVPVGPTILRIGSRNSNQDICNSHIRRVAYYPRRLDNAILGRITS